MSSDVTSIQPQFNLNEEKSNAESLYEFENFRLDAAHLMLYKDEQPVALAPKVVETLVALVERRGELVSKEEMMKRLWADAFVEDANLTQNIYLLRKTLGKTADGRDLIETFRRRGYRFNGQVRNAAAQRNEDAGIEKISNEEAAASGSNKKWFWTIFAAAALGSVILAFFTVPRFFNRPARTGAANIALERLTPNLKTFNPAISPSGELVAFAKAEERGALSLWLLDRRAGESRQLSPPVLKGYLGLQFSPDGKQIYYQTRREDELGNVLARIGIADSAAQVVANGVFTWFTVSPDGKQVAFVRDTNLIVCDTDGNFTERIVASRDGKTKWFASQNAQPAWSPDGKRIVVSGGFFEQGIKKAELIEVDAADATEKRIQTPASWDKIGSAAWTSDGEGFYVIAQEGASKPQQIWFLPATGGAAQKITNDLHNYNSISLTADGRQIAAEQIVGKSVIWLGDAKKFSDLKPIASNDDDTTGVQGLAFMPDGKIIYTSPRSGNVDLWTMSADGTNQKQLTANIGGVNIRPRVTPDGKFIVFQSYQNGKNQIWRMDADAGKNLIQLTEGENDRSPSISSDGQWVYYAVPIDQTAEIWKVSINGGEPVKVSITDNADSPSISPDGNLLAFEFKDKTDGERKIGILRAATGETLKTFVAQPVRRVIEWTEDSKSLIYIQHNTPNLWQLPVDGSQPPRRLTDFDLEQTWNFAFSLDRRKIAIARGTINNESVLISILK